MELWIILILCISNIVFIVTALEFASKSHRYRDDYIDMRNHKDEYYSRVSTLETKNAYLESLLRKPEEPKS